MAVRTTFEGSEAAQDNSPVRSTKVGAEVGQLDNTPVRATAVGFESGEPLPAPVRETTIGLEVAWDDALFRTSLLGFEAAIANLALEGSAAGVGTATGELAAGELEGTAAGTSNATGTLATVDVIVTTPIRGNLYDQEGHVIVVGQFIVHPENFIEDGFSLVAPMKVYISCPPDGYWVFDLVPSDTIRYIAEFNPDPADTITPLKRKSGYFLDVWTIPTNVPGPIDLVDLVNENIR